MSMKAENGATLIVDALLRAGVDCVFCLPGSQNVAFFDALRTSRLRTVVATHELSAAMMANGYYRASGRLAALATIPGPGFTWALTGIAEAALDSAALIHLVGTPASSPGRRFQLQAIDQTAIVAPIARAVHRIEHAAEATGVIEAAVAHALAGEPGPVVVHIDRSAMGEYSTASAAQVAEPTAIDDAAMDEAVRSIAAAKRCVIFAGQGCNGASEALLRLAETLSALVITTTSGRGVVSEDHPLSLGFEFGGNGVATFNELIDSSDLVIAIGCKFSHNGSRGFRLRIPREKLIHVDASDDVLGANYPARVALRAHAARFIDAALERVRPDAGRAVGFDHDEIARFRARAHAEGLQEFVEPRVDGMKAADFFAMLRLAMPPDSTLVTDSGLHQVLARLHFRVLKPRGLITPTNLQSMGFGIGAAIGACLADPKRTVVALIGDGGLAMSGLELVTAVRERLRLVVLVFVDSAYGLIRMQQLAATGRTFATEFSPINAEALAQTVGAEYVRVDGNADLVLRQAMKSEGVTLIEVRVGDTLPMYWLRAKAIAKTTMGPRTRSRLKRLLRGS